MLYLQYMRKKERKSEFIIVRFTIDEKEQLQKQAKKNFRNISKHIRVILGLDKPNMNS